MVTSPLSGSQENTGQSFDVTGTATVYPTHKPNKGDMFIADIGDGRSAVFAVTEVTRKTYLKDAFAEINYTLVDYVDSKPEILADLERKSIKRTVFYKEFLLWGQNPVVLEGDYQDLVSLKKLYADLVTFYFKDFYSGIYQTLLIPNQSMPAYDPYVTAAMLEWITVEEVPLINRVKQPVVLANENSQSYTLWSALAQMNSSYLNVAIQQCRLMDTTAFRWMPEVSSIYFTGIGYVTCPKDTRTDVDRPYDSDASIFNTGGSLLATTGLRWSDLTRYSESTNLRKYFDAVPGNPAAGTLPELPNITPVTIDEYYVLTEAFYKNNDSVPLSSKLEVLTKQALKQEPIDRVTLLKLAKEAMDWPNLERFYYMPILFALMKVCTRSL